MSGEALVEICCVCGLTDVKKHKTLSTKLDYPEIFLELFGIDVECRPEDQAVGNHEKLCRNCEKWLQSYNQSKSDKSRNNLLKRRASFTSFPVDHGDSDTCVNKKKGAKSHTALLSDLEQNVETSERGLFLEGLLTKLTSDEKEKLLYLLGCEERKKIRDDASVLYHEYKDPKTLWESDKKGWIGNRSKTLVSFIHGLHGTGDTSNIYFPGDLSDGDSYRICLLIEELYHVAFPKLVSSHSFLVNMYCYNQVGSKTVANLLGKALPSGSYKTLTNFLIDMNGSEPECPDHVVMNTLDNEQVVIYKKSIKPNNVGKTSVITTRIFTELDVDDELRDIQKNETLKPKLRFCKQDIQEEIEAIKQESCFDSDKLKQLERELDDFVKLVEEMQLFIGEYGESVKKKEELHMDEVNRAISLAIHEVSEDQEKDKHTGLLQDYIDMNIAVNEHNTIACTICLAQNPRKKQKCVNCGEKGGLKAARDRKEVQPMSTVTEEHNGPTTTIWSPDDEVQQRRTEESTERYKHVPTGHSGKTNITIADPVLVNPNSYENVALVLRQIGIDNKITRYCHDVENGRYWTFVTCDGRPHSLIQNIFKRHVMCQSCQKSFTTVHELRQHYKDKHTGEARYLNEFDWFYLRCGGGHYEMNGMKAFLELCWIPYFEHLVGLLGFKTPKAKEYVKKGSNNHLTWQIIVVFYESALREITLPYVRKCILDGVEPDAEGFYADFKQNRCKNPNFDLLFTITFTYAQAIVNYRMAIRRNNSDLSYSAKYHINELFYARSHPYYQNISLFEELQYAFMPQEVKKVWDSYTSITVTGNPSRGQDFDFILEEVNRTVKQFLPTGSVPCDKTWINVCRNKDKLEKLMDNVTRAFDMQTDVSTRYLDVQDSINVFRHSIRKYINTSPSDSLTSLSGKKLHKDLLDIRKKVMWKKTQKINRDVLGKDIQNDPESSTTSSFTVKDPVYITQEEFETYASSTLSKDQVVNKIQECLASIIATESGVRDIITEYQSKLQSVAGKEDPVKELISLYDDVRDFLDVSQFHMDHVDEEGMD